VKESRLIIMRHAKSDWHSSASSDFDRPLSSRGERDGVRMGKWLQKKQFYPEYIISSPATRTRQTSNLVAEEMKFPSDEIIYLRPLYLASLSELLATVESHSNNVNCMLIVGHNPGMDDLLCHLATEPPAFTSTGKLMTTANIAVLNFGKKAISVESHSASVELLARPKEIYK